MATSSSRTFPGVGQLLMITRPGLTCMVAFSTLVGYFAVAGYRQWPVALALGVGIALLSAAASILNQIQERDIDAKMARTCLRPLATGTISLSESLMLASGCAATGLVLLAAVSSSGTLAGLLALLLYNGLYTPLKKHSSLALFPGAISGALPVAVGWLAASGPLLDPQLWSLLIFMILWQVPHFICIAIRERDYYSPAGLALVPVSVTTAQLVQLTRLWTAALAVGGLQLVAVGLVHYQICIYAVVGTTLWLTLSTLLPYRVASPEVFATFQGRRLKLFLMLFFLLILADTM